MYQAAVSKEIRRVVREADPVMSLHQWLCPSNTASCSAKVNDLLTSTAVSTTPSSLGCPECSIVTSFITADSLASNIQAVHAAEFLHQENIFTLSASPTLKGRHTVWRSAPCYTSACCTWASSGSRLTRAYLSHATTSMCTRIIRHYQGCDCKHVDRTLVCPEHAAAVQKRKTRARSSPDCQNLELITQPLADRNSRICKKCCRQLRSAAEFVVKTGTSDLVAERHVVSSDEGDRGQGATQFEGNDGVDICNFIMKAEEGKTAS
nr:hypothetical protein CFP56_13113 [Quercus suber]